MSTQLQRSEQTEERRVREERGEEKVLKIFLEVVQKQHSGIFLKKAQLRHIFYLNKETWRRQTRRVK